MSSLFGGGNSSTPQINYQPQGFNNATGFGVTNGQVNQSPTLTSNIGGLQSTFGQQASALGGLASTVQPGFSQFRQAGLAQMQSIFQGNLSNLKQNLVQRGVAGSSFANDQLNNAAATEAQNEADFTAQSYLQELNSSFQLIQAQYQAQSQSYSTAINQSNIETATAAQLTAQNNQIGAQIATANAQLTAQAQNGAGSFFGSLIGAGANLAAAGISAYGSQQAASTLAAALLA